MAQWLVAWVRQKAAQVPKVVLARSGREAYAGGGFRKGAATTHATRHTVEPEKYASTHSRQRQAFRDDTSHVKNVELCVRKLFSIMALVPGAFFLDDPSDGVSSRALLDAGVTVERDTDSVASRAALRCDLELQLEHSFNGAVAYRVSGGSAIIDVRDPASAWVRILVPALSLLRVGPGVFVRVAPPGTPVYPALTALDCAPEVSAARERAARLVTTLVPRPVQAPLTWGVVSVHDDSSLADGPDAPSPAVAVRFAPGSEAERAANIPHFSQPGEAHTRDTVVELCASFYSLGWVTGTGGSISIRHGARTFMAPSGVQKERMQPQDIFVLDADGAPLYSPQPLPGKPRLKLSQCAPLFHHAFTLRGAGACIHTHDLNAVLCTLQSATEFRITHQEMIKGIAGHGFLDEVVIPVIENTPHECDLADSLGEAMRRYPKSNAVLVRRHGVYVWGASWEAAKTQAECYHYLFEAAVRMRAIGVDPAAVPARVTDGIGAARSYEALQLQQHGVPAASGTAVPSHSDSCCGAVASPAPVADATGFTGSVGVAAQNTTFIASSAEAASTLDDAPLRPDIDALLLDIEGCTTSISFVTDTLFPYAAQHVRAHLEQVWGTAELVGDIAALAEQSAADVAAGIEGAAAVAVSQAVAAEAGEGRAAAASSAALEAICSNVAWQMGANRKTGALKQLQGHVWRAGYASGALRGHVFGDVPPALRAWAAAGLRTYIYSSGSREAQRLLFAHTDASVGGASGGDLRPLLSGFFDTSVGPKTAPESYADIALSLGVDSPARVLFLTDALFEAQAAKKAGFRVAVTDRPGNAPLPAGHGFRVITSLADALRS